MSFHLKTFAPAVFVVAFGLGGCTGSQVQPSPSISTHATATVGRAEIESALGRFEVKLGLATGATWRQHPQKVPMGCSEGGTDAYLTGPSREALSDEKWPLALAIFKETVADPLGFTTTTEQSDKPGEHFLAMSSPLGRKVQIGSDPEVSILVSDICTGPGAP